MEKKEYFVAINNITVLDDYKERMEYLFKTRKKKIDETDGFIDMKVLKPHESGQDYLVISRWKSHEYFDRWSKSEAFLLGHERAFADMNEAEKLNQPMPMKSIFKGYSEIAE